MATEIASNQQGDVVIRAELVSIRTRLLAFEAIHQLVQGGRRRLGYRDFVVSNGALFGGTALHLAGYRQGAPLAVVGLLLQIVGIIGWSSLMHDAWHKLAVPHRRMNELLGKWVAGPLFLLDFERFRKRHFAHHRFVGADQDPDSPAWRPTPRAFTLSMLGRLLIVPKLLQVALGRVRNPPAASGAVAPEPRISPRSAAAVRTILFHAVWAGSAFAFGWVALATAYVLPILLSSVLVSIREFREHFYVERQLVTCDVDCPTWERLFIGGGYFNFHALHHVFPELPQRRLPELYACIRGDEELRAVLYGAWPFVGWRASYFGVVSQTGPVRG